MLMSLAKMVYLAFVMNQASYALLLLYGMAMIILWKSDFLDLLVPRYTTMITVTSYQCQTLLITVLGESYCYKLFEFTFFFYATAPLSD